MVLGEENYDALANTIILSSANSWFLRRWYWEYKSFDDQVWSHHSCFVPWSLWHLFPNTVHVVKRHLLRFFSNSRFPDEQFWFRPNWEEVFLIYGTKWNWHDNYAIHLFARFIPFIDKKDRTPDEFRYLDTTYGEIARFILFNNEKLQILPQK